MSIDRRHGFARRVTVTSAAAHDGAQLANVLDPANTASDVWAELARGHAKRSVVGWPAEGDTAYRSKTNEAYLRQTWPAIEDPLPAAARPRSDAVAWER